MANATTPVIQVNEGKVGIGLVSPTTPLHVIGIAQIVTSSDTAFYEGAGVRMFGSQSYSFRNSPGNTRAIINVSATGTSAGNLALFNASNVETTKLNNAGDSYLNGGNVGIGLTNPTKQLHLKRTTGDVRGIMVETTVTTSYAEIQVKAASEFRIGTGGSSTTPNGQFYIYDATAGAHRFDINALGNVGIGTISPLSLSSNTKSLTINSTRTDLTGALFLSANSVNKAQLYWDSSGLVNNVISGDTRFFNGGSERMRIESGGDVGIGTTNPGTILHVKKIQNAESLIRLENNRQDLGDVPIFGIVGNNSGVDVAKVSFYREGGGSTGHLAFSTKATNAAGLTEKVRFDANGNVGIGTDTPDTLLHLKSDGPVITLQRDNNGNAAGAINFEGNDGVLDWQIATNFIVGLGFEFNYAGSNKFYINTNGNVGIGTTSPAQRLDVAGNVVIPYANGYFMDTVGAAASNFIKTINNFETVVGTSRGSAGFGVFGNANIRLGFGTSYTAAQTKLTIIPSGSIQFNAYNSTNQTGSPTHILGTDANGLVVKSTAGSSIGPWLPLAAGSGDPLSGDLYLNDSKFVRFTTTGGSSGNASIDFSTGAALTFTVNSSSAPIIFKQSSTEWMRIIANGNVGIGTTNPLQKLHLDGNNYNTATRTTFLIRDLGNNYDQGDNAVDIVMRSRYWSGDQNTSQNSKIRHIKDNSNGSTGTQLRFSTTTRGAGDSSDKMTILASGNVGIGTTSPGAKLEVKDGSCYLRFDTTNSESSIKSDYNLKLYADDTGDNSSSFQNMQFFTAGNNERMRIDASGNVGIGTTIPAAKLDVEDGHIRNTNNSSGDFLDIFCDGDGTGSSIISSSNNDIVIRPSIGELGIKANAFGNTGGHGLLKIYNGANTVQVQLNSSGDSYLNGGNVGIGTSSPDAKLEIVDTSNPGATAGSVIIEGRRDGSANLLALRARDASAPSSALPNGQGSVIRFQGFDGTDFENMAFIQVAADGQAVANGDAPSFMGFGTSSNGSSNPTEKMRISSAGAIKFNAYGAGTLVTDASGNITASSGGGVTGSGANTRIAFWSGTSAITSDADLTFDTATNKLTSSRFQIPNNGDYLGVDTSGNARTLISLTNTNDVEISNSALSVGSDTVIFFGDSFKVKDGGSTRLSIDTGGKVAINNPNNNESILNIRDDDSSTNGHIAFENSSETNGIITSETDELNIRVGDGVTMSDTKVLRLFGNGNMTITGTLTQNSDATLKENIKPIESALDKVKQMQGVEFNKINSNTKEIGVIAQDIEKIIPELVLENEKGIKSVAYGNITAVLIEAIKEQQKQIELLKQQLNK